MRIAIVGSGVSGLVAAHLLHPHHEVTMFEARDRIGGHVNTVEVPSSDGSPLPVDTGFIVYNEHNYPVFSKLLDQLGVETQPSDMSFSVRCDRTGLEYNGSTIRQLFAQRRNLFRPSFHRMLRDILRFNREATSAILAGASDLTLGAYVAEAGYSSGLSEHYLLPMGSALWSVPRDQVLEMPAAFFVRFFENHGMLTVDDRPEWRVVRGGSERYVERLVEPFRDRVRTNTPVRRVERITSDGGSTVTGVTVDGESFDHVILACHSDQALSLLADPTRQERSILGAMPYQENDIVLHTDESVLPRTRRAWGAWNYHLRGDTSGPATVTYNMNLLQTLSGPRTYCVTLNATDLVAPESILYRTTFHHPAYTTAGFAAQERHVEISDVRRTHFCGAYWGFGFHEDGARSGVRVAEALGASL
jgi:predicted NAD/FAD-binding protein